MKPCTDLVPHDYCALYSTTGCIARLLDSRAVYDHPGRLRHRHVLRLRSCPGAAQKLPRELL